MSDEFDPYHQWLAIPPSEQPPNHYRLLGIGEFEEDPEVIQSAADRQMGHLRTFQAGRHGAASQKVLNEIAAAKLTLMKPDRKAAYDAQLRTKQPAMKLAEPGERQAIRVSRVVRSTAPTDSGVALQATQQSPLALWRQPRVLVAAGALLLLGIATLASINRGTKSSGLDLQASLNRSELPPGSESSPITQSTERKVISQPASPAMTDLSTSPKSRPGFEPAPTTIVPPPSAIVPSQIVVMPRTAPKSVESPAAPTPAGSKVDLLKLIDLNRGLIGRTPMSWDGTALVGAPKSNYRVQIPYHPQVPTYRIDLLIECLDGGGPVNVGLAVAGRQFLVGIDFGGSSFVSSMPGRGNYHDARWRVKIFEINKPVQISILVNPKEVSMSADGRVIIDKFDHRPLETLPSWNGPDEQALSIGWNFGGFRILAAEFIPL